MVTHDTSLTKYFDETINLFFDEWNTMRDKKQKMIINYEEYFEWKINYKVKEDRNE